MIVCLAIATLANKGLVPDAAPTTNQFNRDFAITSSGVEQLSITRVAGANNVLNGSVTGDSAFRSNSNNLFIGTVGAFKLNLETNNVQRLVIDSTGNVGIGTTAPVGKLNVATASAGQALVQLNELGDQAIFTASAAGATKFVIANDGNVGIGVTSSAAKLYVGQNSGANATIAWGTTAAPIGVLGYSGNNPILQSCYYQ